MINKLEKGKKYWIIMPATDSTKGQEMIDALRVHDINIGLVTTNSAIKEFQIFEL